MAILNHSRKAYWAGLGMSFLFSCTTPIARDAVRPQEPAKQNAAKTNQKVLPHALNSMVDQAHRAIEKGIAALNTGAADEANAWFSQALKPFLDKLNQPNPELKNQFDLLVDEIHKAERSALARSSTHLQQSKKIEATKPLSKSQAKAQVERQEDDENDSDSSLLSQMLDPEIIENEIAQLHPTTAIILHDAAYDFPVVQNNIVDRFANYLSTDRAHKIGEGLENATLYVPMMRNILAEKGVPRDLCYLPVIESSYKVRVRSHAAAVGIWQFIASTAKLYGLRVNWWIDERLHPLAPSEAAANFFSMISTAISTIGTSCSAPTTPGQDGFVPQFAKAIPAIFGPCTIANSCPKRPWLTSPPSWLPCGSLKIPRLMGSPISTIKPHPKPQPLLPMRASIWSRWPKPLMFRSPN